MAIESPEDRAAMLDPDDFGVTARLISPDGSQTRKVNGIFDREYVPVSGAEVEIEGNDPQLMVRSSDVAGVGHGWTVEIDGEAFVIVNPRPDGTGITYLHLRDA